MIAALLLVAATVSPGWDYLYELDDTSASAQMFKEYPATYRDGRRAWVHFENKKGESVKALFDVECSKQRIWRVQAHAFYADGKYAYELESEPPQTAVPGTHAALIVEYICRD